MTAQNPNNPIRVMLVDDSAALRGIFKRVIADAADIQVVSSASNGEMAINNLTRQDIEVVILDVEMPVMDGFTALPKLIEIKPDLQIIMASTLTPQNAEISMRALNNGAKDYITKPEPHTHLQDNAFHYDLLQKIRTLGTLKRRKTGESLPTSTPSPVSKAHTSKAEKVSFRQKSSLPAEIITIGSSTGGPQALTAMLKHFPKNMKQPIVITQHMPPTFTAILAKQIAKDCDVICKEAQDGDELTEGMVYIAPGGFHLTVGKEKGKNIIRLSNTPPENFCKPSVDPMLRSIAETYGPRVLTIILTGMGSDGLKGAQIIAENGGTIIAQDEATSVVWGMPGAVYHAGLCSAVLPLNEIPFKIKEYVG